MHKIYTAIISGLLLLISAQAQAVEGAQSSEIPGWFKTSFLDLREDITEATASGKRVMLYFHQEGCPYCAELVNNNFSQKPIVDYMAKHIDAIELDIWGDREVTDLNGKTLTEKAFAQSVKAWFTPTLLFFDEKGKVILRINGYYPPHRFQAALNYVGEKQENKMSFREYYAKKNPPKAKGTLHNSPYFSAPPYRLAGKGNTKPIAVFFEQKDCPSCDNLHRDIMAQQDTKDQLKRFTVVQLDMWGKTPVTTPQGKATTSKQWASELGIVYAPTVVLFDGGKEIIRSEAFLKSYHMQSIFDYVASGAYKTQPNLQRYISQRADTITEQGGKVDIWK